MNHILVIGTLPPCPRCKLLTELVTNRAEIFGVDAEIRHIAFTSEEARNIASKLGLEPGTAKDVAKKLGQEVRLEDMPKISQLPELEFMKALSPELMPYENLFKEVYILDHWLREYETSAERVGILMTPILIINDVIKHTGSVPDLKQIDKWISELCSIH